MKKWISQQAAILGVLAVTLLVPVFLWDQMPDQVPVHWNINGEVDRYGSKAESLLIIPAISLVLSVLLWVLPAIDPKNKVNTFSNTLRLVHLALVVSFFAMSLVLAAASMKEGFDVTRAILIVVLMMFLVLGNFFGKLRPNYFVGIRTPWTLENGEVWIKTHRFAGKLWVAGSVLMMIAVLAVSDTKIRFWIFISGTIILSFWPMVYSFILFQKSKKS